MFFSPKKTAALTVKKKAAKDINMIYKYTLEEIGFNDGIFENCSCRVENFENLLSRGGYAKAVSFSRSGNEESLYCFVNDEKDNNIFWCRMLEVSSRSYGLLASLAGMMCENINYYLTIN